MRTLNRKSEIASRIVADPLVTVAKLAQMQSKLIRLKAVRPEAAAEVSRLAQLGDFSENAEYQAAKGRLRGINSGITSLENQLNHAVIITPQKQTDTVQIGHTVTVAAGDTQKIYQLLGSAETNPGRGIISHNSPIGAALVGCRVGDAVKIKLADKTVEYRIIKIA
ncbi:MAG: GreA/GreB family elongation factor [Patescibacteria group bacterium]